MSDVRPVALYPVASLQAAMIVNHIRAQPGSGVDVVQMISELHEEIDPIALCAAWENVTRRHDVLRTAFRWEESEDPSQALFADAPVPFTILDWAGGIADGGAAHMRAFLARDRAAGFDLRALPLQRVTLARIRAREWRMVWTFHHILMDGRSFPIVLREVFTVYDAARRGEPAVLPERRPYREFAEWFAHQDFARAEAFWRDNLRGIPAPTPIPAAFPRAGEQGRGWHEGMLDAASTAALETFARDHGLTMNTIVQGAWVLLLARHSGESDVVFGATRAGRKNTIAGADDVVGSFINTLPVRVPVRADVPIAEWLGELRERWRALFAVEHTPLRFVHRWSEMDPNAPLFDTQVVFENLTLEATLQAAGGPMASRGFRLLGGTNFPLTLLVFGGREMTLQIENARELVDDDTAERLLRHFGTILAGIAATPEALVRDVPMLPADERELVVTTWNDTAAGYPDGETLTSLLAAQAVRTPLSIAVVDDRTRLTYAELDARTTALAARLRTLGVGANALVGVCAERSVEMVIALVAVVKAGGAYVPLDPGYPRERLSFMLQDAAPTMVLAQQHVASTLAGSGVPVVSLDGVAEATVAPVATFAPPAPDDLAYVIFTSGSTGKPKGALNAHRGIVNRLQWMQSEYQLGTGDVVLQKTPFGFDVSVWEFFWPLMTGATLVMAKPGGHRDASYLAGAIEKHGVTVCHFVPSMLRAFLTDAGSARCTSLRDVMASGEALPPALVSTFYTKLPAARLHNLYGPTECAVDVTYWPVPVSTVPPLVVPIGRPVANTQVYMLDERGAPVPIGVAAELHIGGVQVGGGYLRRPELTREKFVRDPFSSSASARLYRTGDRARWRPDGTVEYLGRLDFQVKIRGFRIELGEIESALDAHPAIRESVVVARADGSDEPRLVAYLVPRHEAPTIGIVRAHLLETLPEFMVPAAFVWLNALPLSSNGKVDRRALPAPELDRQVLSRAFVAPRTPDERTLADIWARVLRLERVGVDDNFFELGGDSLLSVQIVTRAAQAGLRVTLTQVMRNPTVSALATFAERTAAPELQTEVIGAVPLTPVQRWFFEGHPDGPDHWNQAFMFALDGHVNAAALEDAIAAATRDHDSFRLRFERHEGTWTERCEAEGAVAPLDVVDVGLVDVETRRAIVGAACDRAQSSLDIARGPLLRAVLFRVGAEEPARLLLAAHHLAIDGVSWGILLRDIETAYAQRARGEPIVLAPRTVPFARWALRLASTTTFDGEVAYWEREGRGGGLALPVDVPATGTDVAGFAHTMGVRLDENETRALLQAVPAAYNTQINDVLLTALASALGDWMGAGDFVIDLEGHGREDALGAVDLSRTTGWFTTIFPVRLQLGAADVGTRLTNTKELLRAIPNRGLGYGVLRYVRGIDALRAQPAPSLVFNYLGQFDHSLGESSLLRYAADSPGSWYGAKTPRRHSIGVNALVVGGQLELRWTYSTRVHRPETINHVAEKCTAALREIVAHCTASGAGGYTPSDFPLARLDAVALSRVVGAARDIEDVYPVTPLQSLFLGYADDSADPGFEQWRYRLHGAVDARALHAAWDRVVERHAMLRTGFVAEGAPEPLQVVRTRAELPWQEHDLRGLSGDAQQRELDRILADDRARGFVVSVAPLMRCTLIRLRGEEHEFVWSNHHLLLDRWSWPLILLEIAALYPAMVAGVPVVLEPAPRYADFIAWQQQQSPEEARAFWSTHFSGFDALPRFGTINAAAPEHESREVCVTLTAPETATIEAFARSSQLALITVVEGAWALVLAKRFGRSDVSFGVAVAGRDAGVPRIERMVGLTINNLPLRVRVDGDAALPAWLASVQDAQAGVQQFAHVPLARVQEWSGVPWRARLFETLLVFQHDGAEDATRSWLGGAAETRLVHVPTRTAYPLTVMIAGRHALELRITFDARYFSDVIAAEIAVTLKTALLTICAAPGAQVSAALAALPEPSRAATSSASYSEAREYVAPRTATESVLATLWGDVLGAERVGIHDNFFVLGGYSLVATQIMSRVRATLQLDAPVRLLFQHPTIAAFAVALAGREAKPGQLERVARVVQKVQGMSQDEVRRAASARAGAT